MPDAPSRACRYFVLIPCQCGNRPDRPFANSKPEPTPKVDTVPPARDVAYPGTMQVLVDASDVTRAIFRIHQHVPVAAADRPPLSEMGSRRAQSAERLIKNITGFRASSNGQQLKWVRDNLDVYAFHVSVPEGASAIDVDYQFRHADDRQPGAHAATPDMESIQWLSNSMYPAGYFLP